MKISDSGALTIAKVRGQPGTRHVPANVNTVSPSPTIGAHHSKIAETAANLNTNDDS